MSRAVTLHKRAKDVIIEQMKDIGEMTRDEAVELIRPHFMFDVESAIERDLKRKANQLMASIRDNSGTRICFNCKDNDNVSKYVNVETAKSVNDLNKINKMLDEKLIGLIASKSKVANRQKELDGQISLLAVM